MRKKTKDLALMIIAVIAFPAFMYFAVSLGKNLSYSFFYEDLVKKTIAEMVKAESLK